MADITNALIGMLGGGGARSAGGSVNPPDGGGGASGDSLPGGFFAWLQKLYGMDERRFGALTDQEQFQLRSMYAQQVSSRDDYDLAQGKAREQTDFNRQQNMIDSPDDWVTTPDGGKRRKRQFEYQQEQDQYSDSRADNMQKKFGKWGGNMRGGW